MIIISLLGGLGNQMFQYALCCAYQEKGVPVKMAEHTLVAQDIAAPRTPALHTTFDLSYEVISPEAFDEIYARYKATHPLIKRTRHLFCLLTRKIGAQPYYELNQHYGRYLPSLLRTRDNILFGYFQNVRYFSSPAVRTRLRYDFSCPKRFFEGPSFSAWYQEIRQAESVSLHVRRTDYLKPGTRDLYGDICTERYYQTCVDRVLSMHPDAIFYVFSDDKKYAKEHFRGENFRIVGMDLPKVNRTDSVTDASLSDSEEFHLMRFCKHHILANSSFSWWAAWLSEEEDAMILAPEEWVRLPGAPAAPPGLYTTQMMRVPG